MKYSQKIFRFIYAILFSAFIVGGILPALMCLNEIGGCKKEYFLPTIIFTLMSYIAFSGTVLLVQLSFIYPLKLVWYYKIWLRIIFPLLDRIPQDHGIFREIADKMIGRCPHERTEIRRIYDSYFEKGDASSPHNKSNLPAYIRRRDLDKKLFWKDWAFSVVLLFNKIILRKEKVDQKTIYKLIVDLKNQSYGIYNNRGKAFLRNKFQGQFFQDKCRTLSEKIERWLNTSDVETVEIDCTNIPLRWASGGLLPVVNWKEQKWFVLFFRDINTQGWNVANGASESRLELKDIEHLIFREFSEELLVLENFDIEDVCYYRPLTFYTPQRSIPAEKFSQRHITLRHRQDNITLKRSDELIITRHSFKNTPFDLEIYYHDEKGDEKDCLHNDILFLINPTEFGIEILRICEFDLPKDGYLLDGEIGSDNNFLVRRPVILLNIETLRNIYDENGESLGSIVDDNEQLDCKRIMQQLVKDKDFYLFDADINLKKKRQVYLEKEKRIHEYEYDRTKRWFDKFGAEFDIAFSRDCINPQQKNVSTLCPVTWKAIEQVFRYKLL